MRAYLQRLGRPEAAARGRSARSPQNGGARCLPWCFWYQILGVVPGLYFSCRPATDLGVEIFNGSSPAAPGPARSRSQRKSSWEATNWGGLGDIIGAFGTKFWGLWPRHWLATHPRGGSCNDSPPAAPRPASSRSQRKSSWEATNWEGRMPSLVFLVSEPRECAGTISRCYPKATVRGYLQRPGRPAAGARGRAAGSPQTGGAR